jgi:hypothetical protein
MYATKGTADRAIAPTAKKTPAVTAARANPAAPAWEQALGAQPLVDLKLPLGSPLGPKLAISQPGDALEQEADRVADQVMRLPAPRRVSPVSQSGEFSPEDKAGAAATRGAPLRMSTTAVMVARQGQGGGAAFSVDQAQYQQMLGRAVAGISGAMVDRETFSTIVRPALLAMLQSPEWRDSAGRSHGGATARYVHPGPPPLPLDLRLVLDDTADPQDLGHFQPSSDRAATITVSVRRNTNVETALITLYHESMHLVAWLLNRPQPSIPGAAFARRNRELTMQFHQTQIDVVAGHLEALALSINSRRPVAARANVTRQEAARVARFLVEEVHVRSETEVFRLVSDEQADRATAGPSVRIGTAPYALVNRGMVDRYIFDFTPFSPLFRPTDRAGLNAADQDTMTMLTDILEGIFQSSVRHRYQRPIPMSIPRAEMHLGITPLQPPSFIPRIGGATRSAPFTGGAPLQPKLSVGARYDPLEQEADRVADQLLAAPTPALAGGAPPRIQRSKGEASGETHTAPASVDSVLSHAGRPLEPALQEEMESRFGRDFSRVQVHSGAAAEQSSREVHANAYTVGNHIVFGAGQFAPATQEGRRLLAHELTHVVQQGASDAETGVRAPHPLLQRDIPEAQLPSTPDTTIRRDPNYMDNRIQRVEFFSAQLAIIHYEDGAQLRLGLVPGEIQPPVQAVDYRTLRRQHVQLVPEGTGQTRFIPRGAQLQAPGMTGEQVIREFGRTITYRVEAASRRIVPTEVNDITAPVLCEVLRRAEAEYIRSTDELARGMIHFLEVLEIALIIASFIPTGGGSAGGAGARGAGAVGAAEAGAVGRAASSLRQFFLRLLRSGASEAITVEGVGFGGVRVVMGEGRVMTVFRNTIVNAERVSGQGRLIHGAFEQAAVAAAREAGATSVRVALQTVVNAQWAAYLESLGYTWQVLPTATGFTRVLIRTLTL